MATREELEQKINKLEVNMNRTDRIVNGGEDEDVLIDGGQLVPSIRKWQKELGEEYGFPQELVQQAEDAADRAEDATDRVLEVPTYTSGLELTSYNQLIRDSNGEFWRVSGQVDLPYVTTGAGIPEDDVLVPAGDAVLRQDLANPDKGAAMVARGVVAVDSIADLLALPEGQRKEDLRYLVSSYYGGWAVEVPYIGPRGGGEFLWVPSLDKGKANGVTILDPDSTGGYDGTHETRDDFLLSQGVGAGSGCFVRDSSIVVSIRAAGAVGDLVVDDTLPIQRVADIVSEFGGDVRIERGRYKITQPIVLRAVTTGYAAPPVRIVGDSRKDSEIIKTEYSDYLGIDAAVIGASSDGSLGQASGLEIRDVRIANNMPPTPEITIYGFWMDRGSRLNIYGSEFFVPRIDHDIEREHVSYGIWVRDVWTSTIGFSQAYGDYGIWVGNGTSTTISNTFVNSTHGSYRIHSVYATLIDTTSDACRGTVYELRGTSISATSIGTESKQYQKLLRTFECNAVINNIYGFRSLEDTSTVLEVRTGTLQVGNLTLWARDLPEPRGYLYNNCLLSNVFVENLAMYGDVQTFAHLQTNTQGNRTHVRIGRRLPDGDESTFQYEGVYTIGDENYRWDWWMDTPKFPPVGRIKLGFKNPQQKADGSNAQTLNATRYGDVFFNADPNSSTWPVAGWINTNPALPSSMPSNFQVKHIPMILSGEKADRPSMPTFSQRESPLVGLTYYATDTDELLVFVGSGQWRKIPTEPL